MRMAAHAARPGARLFAYSGQPEPATIERRRVDWNMWREAVDGATFCFHSHSPGSLSSLPDWVARSRAAFGPLHSDVVLWAALSGGDLRSPSASYMTRPGLLRAQILKAVALGVDGVYIWW